MLEIFGINKNKSKKGSDLKEEEKPKVMSVAQEEKVRNDTLNALGHARTIGDNICNELKSIIFENVKKQRNINEVYIEEYNENGEKVQRPGVEVVNDIELRVRTVVSKLRMIDPGTYLVNDTEQINAELHYFSQMLINSLENGDVRTAEICSIALLYGVFEGHKPIPSTLSLSERDTELRNRKKKIENYRNMVDVAKQINLMAKKKKRIIESYISEVHPKYIKAKDEMKEDMDAKPAAYDAVKGLLSAKGLKGELLDAWIHTTSVNTLKAIGDNLINEAKIIDANVKQYGMQLLQLRNAIDLVDVNNTAALDSKIREKLEDIPRKMNVMLTSAIDRQKQIDTLLAECDDVLNNPDFLTSAISAGIKYEEDKQMERQKVIANIEARDRRTKDLQEYDDIESQDEASKERLIKAKIEKAEKEIQQKETKQEEIKQETKQKETKQKYGKGVQQKYKRS